MVVAGFQTRLQIQELGMRIAIGHKKKKNRTIKKIWKEKKIKTNLRKFLFLKNCLLFYCFIVVVGKGNCRE